ncbi:MAG TPA: hypothetical protein VEZ71_10620 [Archangium sp.]|nr:hypothetical protein [Archangium sp.]
MADNPLERQHEKERQHERERLRNLEAKDLEVEADRGPRPLEGFAGGHTTWTGQQDDSAASEEHARDAEESWSESEQQVKRLAPPSE